jgi:hypothetical protein
MTEENNTVFVSEDKFNGTATLIVEGVEDEEQAKNFANKFWREEYDTSPSRIVAEKDGGVISYDRYIVMVADHSSGSLKSTKEYEL